VEEGVKVAEGRDVWLGSRTGVEVGDEDGCGVGLAAGEGCVVPAGRETLTGASTGWQAVSRSRSKNEDWRGCMVEPLFYNNPLNSCLQSAQKRI
jgi:hypothetical protein